MDKKQEVKLRPLRKDELSSVSGGIITTYGDKFYAVSDDGKYYYVNGFDTYRDAVEGCAAEGWSIESLSPDVFEGIYGFPFVPDPNAPGPRDLYY